MQEKLAICLLASEVEPLSKTGGLADVAGALTRSLHRAGHDVRLFTPCYASIDRAGIEAEPVAGLQRSEERRVGKEWRARGAARQEIKKKCADARRTNAPPPI